MIKIKKKADWLTPPLSRCKKFKPLFIQPPDFFVGKYASKVGKGVASIQKTLVKEATLFEPAQYAYELNLENDKHGVYLNDEVLDINKDGSLSLSTDIECDDPGCRYFTSIVVSTSVKAGKAVLRIDYDGFDYDEDGNSAGEFSSSIQYTKK